MATLVVAGRAQGPASPCRMAPGSSHRWCGLPWGKQIDSQLVAQRLCAQPTPHYTAERRPILK
eukprot:scaffold95647_cov40-Prasinocladus_malaysianus.AAC.1